MSKISVIGTGFIARGLINLLHENPKHELIKILTRTKINERVDVPYSDLLTNSLDELIEKSDLIVECTGDPIYACESIDKIMKAGIPVVTMNAEFQVTVGSFFADKGLISEAEGDQPGVLAMLHEEAISMGFKPLVYGNMKGYLNLHPKLEDMEFWADKQNYSIDMTTSFTDGTKVQIEQTLVANGLNLGIAQQGLIGLEDDDTWHGGTMLAQKAKELGYPISDYLLSPKLRPGVFIVAEHTVNQAEGLRNYKMGDGPFYTLDRPYHLCYFEIIKTIDRLLEGRGVLLNNGTHPSISTVTIAKRDLKPGETIKKGIGSFEVRGEAAEIKKHPGHVPIGLMYDVTVRKPVVEGQILTFDDVEIPDSLALEAWKTIEKRVFEG
ncbi:hypothetical protein PF327_00025 [Sulfurovum sp. XTW-4]|uniref:NAD(P)-dependent oxidoreductase n=1 Tax=Sulfurovum xiamenensis TaxID=3019066 RepID=A0ABT7QNI2_9BACT|nr:hypothetical protein [Sulfurovum xiamenensis]MDM5262588.1 hypothetical protein [Sulfurovum xiamenensis]